MSILSLIAAIPDVIWSAVIASALTLGGVLLANRSSTTRLRIQLAHDAKEKSDERAATLRREVYLRAAGEFVKANSYLAALPQMDLTKVNIAEGLQGLPVAAAELQLVSESETWTLVTDLTTRYGEITLKALERLMPLQFIKSDIDIRDQHYNRSQSEIARILAAMSQFNESGQTDSRIFDALTNAFEFQQSQANEYASERQLLQQRRLALQIEFGKFIFGELALLNEHHMKVMVRIRQELGFTSDAEEFARKLEESSKRMAIQLDKFHNSIPKELEEALRSGEGGTSD